MRGDGGMGNKMIRDKSRLEKKDESKCYSEEGKCRA